MSMIELADDAIALPDFNVVAVDHQERQIQRIAVSVKIVAADDLAACIDQKCAVIQVLTYNAGTDQVGS
jgi:hypothetical protein